jgi:hypothetical protein
VIFHRPPAVIALARRLAMATVKKGILVHAGEWWKHLRWTKRMFWKRHRKAEKRLAQQEAK